MNQRLRRSPESARSSSSSGPALPLTQPDGVRGGAFAGYACINDVMPYKWSRPIPSLRAACRTGVSAYDTVAGGRTVRRPYACHYRNVSLIAAFVSGSAPEG